ncbi:hypothetical protein Psal071_00415 [Piscirickettsia salmonis]|nr:hypothetical protein Psal040_00416 [Piscirickettsia salmonis]QGO43915.1 hypothetical protein Psal051_00416 [Piscirickettsia salmonis]QGO58057.1 hypothetical protein Psal071_00415 [Piscirickettsia salmonis]QGO61647.1 hypothetical protein Psal072_00415 [Piscirickettsia salmonis]
MVECADSRHATLCDADSRGFIVVAFCSAILHHWMCKIPTEVATLTSHALETLPNCLANSKTPSLGLIIFSDKLVITTLLV